MIGAAKRYQELLVDLAFRRTLAGGTLEAGVESPLVGALDRCWREMSEAEQDEAERIYAHGRHIAAPALLGIEDQAVAVGDHASPRRAA